MRSRRIYYDHSMHKLMFSLITTHGSQMSFISVIQGQKDISLNIKAVHTNKNERISRGYPGYLTVSYVVSLFQYKTKI